MVKSSNIRDSYLPMVFCRKDFAALYMVTFHRQANRFPLVSQSTRADSQFNRLEPKKNPETNFFLNQKTVPQITKIIIEKKMNSISLDTNIFTYVPTFFDGWNIYWLKHIFLYGNFKKRYILTKREGTR